MKVCSQCGEPQRDSSLIVCPKCHGDFVEKGMKLNELSDVQLKAIADRVFKSWKFWCAFLACFLLTGYAVYSFVDTILDSKVQTHIHDADSRLANQIDTGYTLLSNQIALKLQEPNVQKTIEEVATKQTTNLMMTAINPALSNLNAGILDANSKLATVSNEITNLSERMDPWKQPIVSVNVNGIIRLKFLNREGRRRHLGGQAFMGVGTRQQLATGDLALDWIPLGMGWEEWGDELVAKLNLWGLGDTLLPRKKLKANELDAVMIRFPKNVEECGLIEGSLQVTMNGNPTIRREFKIPPQSFFNMANCFITNSTFVVSAITNSPIIK